jgi:hypothetical protein
MKMANVKASTTINQPIEKVSEFMSVNENAHQWLSGLVETRVTSEIEGVGYTWTDVMQMFGRRVEIDFIVTEYERNRKVGFKSTRGPMQLSAVTPSRPPAIARRLLSIWKHNWVVFSSWRNPLWPA